MQDAIGVAAFRFALNGIGRVVGWAAVMASIAGLAILGVAIAVNAAGDELCEWARSL